MPGRNLSRWHPLTENRLLNKLQAPRPDELHREAATPEEAKQEER